MGRYLAAEQDEFVRAIVIRALLWPFAVTISGDAIARVFMQYYFAELPLALLNVDLLFASTGIAFRFAAVELQMNNCLRALRAKRNWSQADLAERLGVSRQSANAIETGRFDPSLPLAFKWVKLFNTTVESIFFGRGNLRRRRNIGITRRARPLWAQQWQHAAPVSVPRTIPLSGAALPLPHRTTRQWL